MNIPAYSPHRDPTFIRAFKKTQCVEAWVEHVGTGKK